MIHTHTPQLLSCQWLGSLSVTSDLKGVPIRPANHHWGLDLWEWGPQGNWHSQINLEH